MTSRGLRKSPTDFRSGYVKFYCFFTYVYFNPALGIKTLADDSSSASKSISDLVDAWYFFPE